MLLAHLLHHFDEIFVSIAELFTKSVRYASLRQLQAYLLYVHNMSPKLTSPSETLFVLLWLKHPLNRPPRLLDDRRILILCEVHFKCISE